MRVCMCACMSARGYMCVRYIALSLHACTVPRRCAKKIKNRHVDIDLFCLRVKIALYMQCHEITDLKPAASMQVLTS